MAATRRVHQISKAVATREGAGVHLHRAIGFGEPGQYDPFLLLDDFRSDRPDHYRAGFPWHPHRGMETITYVLRGRVEHQDNLGNRGVIGPGDVQWMTAGSGIIHQEMPQGDPDGAMYGFQLWANLPASHKMMKPRYRGIAAAEIPIHADPEGATVRVIAGQVGDVTGPVTDVITRPQYLDVELPAGRVFSHATPRGHTVFAYVIAGKGVFDPDKQAQNEAADAGPRAWVKGEIDDRHLVWFGDGDGVRVVAVNEPVRFLLVAGAPIGEPIAWQGPIVMNTEDELRTAFAELDEGTFIKDGR
jgi:redox-sensitive bicupin YhaK (pirin superfamily)